MNKKTKVVSLLLVISLMMTACGSIHGRQPTIEGGDLIKSSEYVDQKYISESVDKLQEKYHRHFDNGMYFEDLHEAKAKLNEEYQQYLKKQLDPVFPYPYILRTRVEFVNSEVKAYAQGKKTFQEILKEPGKNIMSLKANFHGFRPNYETIKYSEEAYPEYALLEKMSTTYIENGLDYLEIWVNEYPKQILSSYPMEEIKKQENIDLYLKDNAKKVFTGYIMKTYYDLGEQVPIAHLWTGVPEKPYEEKDPYNNVKQPTPDDKSVEYIIRSNQYYLKKKYNMDFFSLAEDWYAPIDYPNLYFYSTHYKDIIQYSQNEDYFQSTYYQYLLGEKIQQIFEEEGVSDSMVYFVETEPVGDHNTKSGTSKKSYPFGTQGYTKEQFLFDGYEGNVNINFIVLEKPGETMDKVKLRTVIGKVYPIAGVMENARSTKPNRGYKTVNVQFYKVDDYERKVAVDLFRKHPITERTRRPQSKLSEVFSDKYKIRAETEGFHYLDIFGEKYHREW